MANEAFPEVFATLKPLLAQYAPALRVSVDEPENYSLDLPSSTAYPKGLFFGRANIGRAYVSFHLMPVYVFPDLLDTLSPALRKRMQGKSCFNFKRLEPDQVTELESLTARCFVRCQAEELV